MSSTLKEQREERNRSGFTSLRVTKATAQLVRDAIALSTRRKRKKGLYRWDDAPYRSRVIVSADSLIFELVRAYVGRRRSTHTLADPDTHTLVDRVAHTSSPSSTHTPAAGKRGRR